MKTDREPHDAIWRREMQAERDRAGISSIRIKDQSLERFVSQHSSYRFFTATRNPYSRCISAYTNQLRRFAKKRSPINYLAAKMRAKTSGINFLSKTSKHEFLNETLRHSISFEKFLANLERYTPSFDKHFDLQVNIAKPHIIPYFKIIDLQNLAEGLESIFGSKVSNERMRRLNPSNPGITLQTMHKNSQEAIHRIYARDFEAFGYTP